MENIVRSVGVTRESVIESVQANKCDDICAMYNMLEYNVRDRERERLHTAFTMVPPSSPTSKSPFFLDHVPKSVTEVYNNVDMSLLMGEKRDDRSLNARRHTLGKYALVWISVIALAFQSCFAIKLLVLIMIKLSSLILL